MNRIGIVACVVVLWALAVGGCGESLPKPKARGGSMANEQQRNEVFKYAVNLLNGLGEFDTGESSQEDVQNLNRAVRRLLDGGTPTTVVDQLNQWIVGQKVPAGWGPDPLVDTLPEDLRTLDEVQELESVKLPRSDGNELRQAVWLRDAAAAICGNVTDDRRRAMLLFDWIVRNIQLEADSAARAYPAHRAWQTLLLGRGTASERIWLFALLARQQGLDVVALARPGDEEKPELLRLAALATDNDLYLFDARLGLPIPGRDGRLAATLAEAAGDESLLAELDLDAEHAYPLRAADLEAATALVEASPFYLSRRMALIESRMAGETKLTLTCDASGLAERLRKLPHVKQVQLWTLPYRRLAPPPESKRRQAAIVLAKELQPFVFPFRRERRKRIEPVPALWMGRVLHLMGKYLGEQGAAQYYQLARPRDQEILQAAAQMEQEMKIPQNQFLDVMKTVKQDASYWLGLMAFEREDYSTAMDYFEKRTLEATPDGPWTSGARYNLGRTYEALGRREEAVAVYRQDDSPQRHGNLLRARRLEAER